MNEVTVSLAEPKAHTVQPPAGMRVSVLVPTYNRSKYLGECLDSLLAQTMPALEIIVIDDGSEDDTPAVLARYAREIRCIRKENGGKPTAVNLGLSLAQGELIWIFDDDDVALTTAIENRVNVLQQRPDAAFVFSSHYYGSDDADGSIVRGRLHVVPDYGSDRFFFELMKGCFLSLSSALVRVDAYNAIGGFDAELLSSEDYDMLLRLKRVFPSVFCPEPCAIFRQHDGLRGAKAIRYAGEDRSKVFRQFDQRVGQKLRSSLPLGDYLVPRGTDGETPENLCQALLGRLVVMASKACLPEMVEDLHQLIINWPESSSQRSLASQSISRAICTGYAPVALDYDWDGFKLLLSALPDLPAKRSVLRAIAMGFFLLARGYPAPAVVRWQRLKKAGMMVLESLF